MESPRKLERKLKKISFSFSVALRPTFCASIKQMHLNRMEFWKINYLVLKQTSTFLVLKECQEGLENPWRLLAPPQCWRLLNLRVTYLVVAAAGVVLEKGEALAVQSPVVALPLGSREHKNIRI